jgi:CAAX amino terminal protease family.
MMERKTFSRTGLGLFISVIAANIVTAIALLIFIVVILFGQRSGGSRDLYDLLNNLVEAISSGWFSVVLLFLADLVMVFVVWLFVRRLPKPVPQPSTMRAGQKWAMVFVIFCISMAITHLLAEVGWFVNHVLQNLLPVPYYDTASTAAAATDYMGLLPTFVMVCVIAPVMEEILFRKLVLGPLRAFGDTVAILTSGIAFGMFHQNFEQMFFAAAVGILLGYAYVRTNSLWVPIMIHFMLNFIGGVVPSLLDMWIPYYSYSVFCGIIVAFWIIGGCLFFSLRKRIILDPAPYRFSVPVNTGLVLGNAGVILFLVLCLGMSVLTAMLPSLAYL